MVGNSYKSRKYVSGYLRLRRVNNKCSDFLLDSRDIFVFENGFDVTWQMISCKSMTHRSSHNTISLKLNSN